MSVSRIDREIEGRDSVGLYLDEIARTPLLDAETEVELANGAVLKSKTVILATGARWRQRQSHPRSRRRLPTR